MIMERTLLDGCLTQGREALLEQWHTEKNRDLTPERVPCGSHKKVWWCCDKGHVWQAQIKSRFYGAGCPICANKQIIVGENDLRTTHPEISLQWHAEKNGELMPEMVLAGSQRKVWWCCNHGHEWKATILSRSKGSGCPICANRKILPGVNDLASTFPQIAKQWLNERNAPLQANMVSVYSNRRVWWKCEKGHQWQGVIARRTVNGSGCPCCAGKKVRPGFNDLATVCPLLAKEWHSSLNGLLTPQQVTKGSHQKVWWECSWGHAWKSVIYARTKPNGTGCPICAGKTKIKSIHTCR